MKSKSVDKVAFLDMAIREKKDIAAFHFNDVWCDFADLFHKKSTGKYNKHSTIMADFKKHIQHAASKHGLSVAKLPVTPRDRITYGVRNIWSIKY